MTRHVFTESRCAYVQPARVRSWLLVALAVTVAACGRSSPPADPTGGPGGRGAPPAMPVEIITLAEKPLERVAEFVGTIKSRRSTTIQPQAEGILTSILVK